MSRRQRWFRDEFREAIWETEALKPAEIVVALAYAEYAGSRENPRDDLAWVSWQRLSQMTGIRSKSGLSAATKGLIAAGWLIKIEDARQHRSPRYRLAIPDHPEVRETYLWDAG